MKLLSPSVRAGLAVALTVLFWASAYPAIRIGLRGYTPGQLAALRFLTSSLLFAAYAALRRPTMPRGRDLFRVALAGALGIAAYNLLLNTGELTVSAGAASFLINCMPVFAALLAVAFLGERLGPPGWAGITLSFAGVGVLALSGPDGLRFGGGAILVLLAALCAAIMSVLQKPLLARTGAIAITACLMWSGALLLTPFLPGAFGAARHLPAAPTLAAIYLGIFPAAAGYLTWAYALSRFSLSQTASLLYMIPLVTVVMSYFWIGERPSPIGLSGGVLALAGVVLLTRYGKQRVPEKSTETVAC